MPLLLDARRSDQPHNNRQESLESKSFVLPSDLLCALHEAGLQALSECLGSRDDWAELWRASGRGEMANTHVPIIVHEDAVPHSLDLPQQSGVGLLVVFGVTHGRPGSA